MGSEDMDQSEKGEKVEEGKDELNEEKRKLPGLVGEVYAIIHIQIFVNINNICIWLGR